MGNFMEILVQFQEMTVELDDGDNLTKFIGCLKYYNNGRDIN